VNPVHLRTAQFLNPIGRARRELVTPEGVVLTVELAHYTERVGAFLLDFVFLVLAQIFVVILLQLLLSQSFASKLLVTILSLLLFIAENLYFVYFELAWRGATPGKRIVGLRVVDRRGRPLTQNAVVARNLLRQVEAFLPLGALLFAGGSLERLSLALWFLLFALLPCFNRDRLRGGDLLAGTMVIAMPRRRLLEDLVHVEANADFSDRQLRAYGAFELQILEELLRRRGDAETAGLQRDVCARICRKIGWPEPVAEHDTYGFLQRFYTAQRAFLEREQLYGRQRLDKNDAAGR
jgi:uncharacterized RDD family membrane protein YckC